MAEDKKEVAEKLAETDKKKETMAAKKTEANNRLKIHNESSRLVLTTKSGRRKILTLEQALQPHNFKQFTEKHQAMLKGKGQAASEILKSINY